MIKQVGVGFVGLSATGGWAAAGHLPALNAVDGMRLQALTASTEYSTRAAGAAYQVPAYSSIEQLATDKNVDLVVITVKVPRHRELVLQALNFDVPVLCEWPLAVSLEEAEELDNAAAGKRTFVGLQGRSSPTFRWLADLVSQGYVGEVLSASVVASSTEWGSPVSQRLAYTLDRASGATMLTIPFGHAVDLVTMVIGELEEVVATTATRRPAVPLIGSERLIPMSAEDQIAVSGTTASGAVLSVHHRGGAMTGAGWSMVIDGTEGKLEVTGSEFPHIGTVKVRGARGRSQLAELQLPTAYDLFPSLAGTHIHTLAHAYAAIKEDLLNGTSFAPTFADAVRRHRLLDAIVRSATLGQRIRVGG